MTSAQVSEGPTVPASRIPRQAWHLTPITHRLWISPLPDATEGESRPMPAHTTRLRLLAASATVLAALMLTGCKDGTGVRDEGPSTTSSSTHSTH